MTSAHRRKSRATTSRHTVGSSPRTQDVSPALVTRSVIRMLLNVSRRLLVSQLPFCLYVVRNMQQFLFVCFPQNCQTQFTDSILFLISSYMYMLCSIPAMSLSAKQISELGVCWNSVIRKLFNYNKWESVKGVLHGLGYLNVSHLIML